MMLSEWIRDMCDCRRDVSEYDPETIEVLKAIYITTKEEAPTEFQEEESSEDEDYVIEDSSESDESEEEESSEDDYVDSEGEEEIIIKRDKSGFYYLY
tara:strand:+ start:2533 stop:2826 length:294 start_codon:yes stop_codon:yes gene_type:complete